MAIEVRPLPVSVTDEVESSSRRVRVVFWSVLAGLAIAVIWSFKFVDSTIGDNVANHLLGFNAKEEAISSGVVGAAFAFVSGIAGTFTACNISAFGAIAPMMGQQRSLGGRLAEMAKPIGWLSLGMCAVAGTYGAIGAAVGTGIPQLSEATIGSKGFPVRLIQSSVTFGIIGLIFVYLGLAALNVVPNPLRHLYQRHPRAQLLIMGGLIGGFLIGRPFALFHKLFLYAAERHNPLYGALVFMLQSLGNILILSLLFLLLTFGTRGRFTSWLQSKPGRVAMLTGALLIVGGVFFIAYWDVRLPSLFGVGWWPTMPWNNF